MAEGTMQADNERQYEVPCRKVSHTEKNKMKHDNTQPAITIHPSGEDSDTQFRSSIAYWSSYESTCRWSVDRHWMLTLSWDCVQSSSQMRGPAGAAKKNSWSASRLRRKF